jgi:hypothetical protein
MKMSKWGSAISVCIKKNKLVKFAKNAHISNNLACSWALASLLGDGLLPFGSLACNEIFETFSLGGASA